VPEVFNELPTHLRPQPLKRKAPTPRSVSSALDGANANDPRNNEDDNVKKGLSASKIAKLDHPYAVPEAAKVKDIFKSHHKSLNSLQSRLRKTQQTNLRLKKKVNSLSSVVQDLGEKNLLSENACEVLKSSCNVFDHLYERHKKNSDRSSPSREKYPPAIRTFALTLCFYSAKAYTYVFVLNLCATQIEVLVD